MCESDCPKASKIIAGVIGGIIVVIIFPSLLGTSYKTISPLYYGILVDGNTYEIYKDKLYDSGRYYVGLNNYFITFPRHNLYLERSIEIRTK